MKAIFFILVLSYFLIGLLLFTYQRSFLYFPQMAAKNILAEEVQFQNGEKKLSGWILNKGKDKAIIYYGGNAESIEDNIPFYLKKFPQQTTYLVPYRGYGKNDGEPTEQALYSDALVIFDKLKEEHRSFSLVGRSFGSGVATYVAVNREVDKLVLVTPYDSIENIAKDQYPFFPMNILVKDKFLSLERAPHIIVKTLIVIAENDETISRKRTDNLVSKFRNDLIEKVVIKQAGHNDVTAFAEYSESMQSFIK